MAENATLYIHYPCFDGIVSGALAWDFLETEEGWTIDRIAPVSYEIRNEWLETSLPKRCGIVDFLFHPQAAFWADHHQTTFVSSKARREFDRRRNGNNLLFDPRAASCASLIWNRTRRLSFAKPHYDEMVAWADRIDSAQYRSVEEAILGTDPAMIINISLMISADQSYASFLVNELRNRTLDSVAGLAPVRSRYDEARTRIAAGLELVRRSIRCESDGMAILYLCIEHGAIVSRYSPFYFCPEARYSVALIQAGDRATITAMRNPWLDFQSAPLGKILARFGGGGHERVGALIIPRERLQNSRDVLVQVVQHIRRADADLASNNGAAA